MANVKEVDQATFQRLLASDPEIQAVIKRVWGNTPVNQRPGNTPKNLEAANDAASKEIARILQAKGVRLPSHTFVNPLTGSLEGMKGWAGLPTGVKIAIIAGAAATGVGALGAMGAFGGAAAGGAGAGGGAGAASGAATGGTLASTSLAGVAPTIAAGAAPGAGLLGAAGVGGAAASSIPVTAGWGGLLTSGAAKTAVANAAAKTGDKSFLSKIGSLFKSGAKTGLSKLLTPEGLSALGGSLGAVSQSQASNRGTALEAMMEADKMGLNARDQRAGEEKDLWRKIQAANYMKRGGTPKSDAFSTTGWKLPDFGFGPSAISDEDKAMAAGLLPQLEDRMKNPYKLRDYDNKMEPGKTEKTLDWLGPILSGVGAATRKPTATATGSR